MSIVKGLKNVETIVNKKTYDSSGPRHVGCNLTMVRVQRFALLTN